MTVGDITVTAVPLQHSRPTLGYVFDAPHARVDYLTDTYRSPQGTRYFLAEDPPTTMVLDCTHPPERGHGKHNTLEQAHDVHSAVGTRQTPLIHISHELDAWIQAHGTGANGITPATDGQCVDII